MPLRSPAMLRSTANRIWFERGSPSSTVPPSFDLGHRESSPARRPRTEAGITARAGARRPSRQATLAGPGMSQRAYDHLGRTSVARVGCGWRSDPGSPGPGSRGADQASVTSPATSSGRDDLARCGSADGRAHDRVQVGCQPPSACVRRAWALALSAQLAVLAAAAVECRRRRWPRRARPTGRARRSASPGKARRRAAWNPLAAFLANNVAVAGRECRAGASFTASATCVVDLFLHRAVARPTSGHGASLIIASWTLPDRERSGPFQPGDGDGRRGRPLLPQSPPIRNVIRP